MNKFEKLQAARVQLQNKKLKKSGKNKFAGFEYFELSDFLPIVNVIFSELKLFSLFKIVDTMAYLLIYDIEKPDDEPIEFNIPTAELELKGCNAIQALGGVNTYCKRYLYLNALEIVESDLFDSTSGQSEIKQVAPKIKVEPVAKFAEPEKPEQPEISEDLDTILEMKTKTTAAELTAFYNNNKLSVNDKKAFYNEYQKCYKNLGKKEAEAIF